jgi:hypothetical protein
LTRRVCRCRCLCLRVRAWGAGYSEGRLFAGTSALADAGGDGVEAAADADVGRAGSANGVPGAAGGAALTARDAGAIAAPLYEASCNA